MKPEGKRSARGLEGFLHQYTHAIMKHRPRQKILEGNNYKRLIFYTGVALGSSGVKLLVVDLGSRFYVLSTRYLATSSTGILLSTENRKESRIPGNEVGYLV